MEQMERQASDLRYLVTQTPVGLSDSASAAAYETPQPHQASPGSASAGDNSALNPGGMVFAPAAPSSSSYHANKRKLADDDADPDGGPDDGDGDGDDAGGPGGQKHTRSKRNRYISIACNECKRRKIKCNGQNPCQRCGHLNLACLYAPNCCSGNFKDSDEYRDITSQLSRLQDEVHRLNRAVKSMQGAPLDDRITSSTTITPSPSLSNIVDPSRRSEPQSTGRVSFRGPTSMAYSLDVANKTISDMGYRSICDVEEPGQQTEETRLPRPRSGSGSGDPLLEYSKDEIVRLCQLHEEEIGIMYPVLDIQAVIVHGKNLASFLESSRNQPPTDLLNDDKTLQLKAIMCCALVVEEAGHSERATRLFDSMEAVLNRKLMAEQSNVGDLPLLALLAGYRFLSNDEVLAWRVIGQVTRLCLELGIHQRETLMKIQNESERRNALMSFWSAYILDRRWAFATGLPYILQDDDVDSELPYPEEYPFLVAMINYSRLAAKVWRQVYHFGPVLARELRQEEIERLDQDIRQWYDTVPAEVRVLNWVKEKRMTSTPSYNLQRLRIWTYLRFNQMRIWLYTPILHSATSIMVNPVQAQRVVDLAKDTIRYLSHLNNTTNLYRRNQIFYHQFLSSAIAVVFLASVHAPVRFSAVCREEFYSALELVKDLSAKSWGSQRLWRTIKSLKDVAPRFGLNPDSDSHSNAALGMMGLARGHANPADSDQSRFPTPAYPPFQPAPFEDEDRNGMKIQSEMSRMFEGYVGLNGFQGDDGPRDPQTDLATPESAATMWGADGTVFPYFRDMF